MFNFHRLVRFETEDGESFYGEAPEGTTGPGLIGQELSIYRNPFEDGATLLDTKKRVAKILCPLSRVAHIYGVGLNYKAHATEAGLPTPEYPMIFSKPVGTLVRHLSRGMTLRRFSVILTGTPSGVGALMKPPQWLQHGDVVVVEIEKIGQISNRMDFGRH